MDTAAVILVIAYAVPIGLVALLLGRPIDRRLLIAIACLLPLFYALHFFGLRSLLGWPTPQDTEENFVLLGEYVIEPNKKLGEPGRVFLWTLGEGEQAPRAHELPYYRGLHEELDAASRRRKAGHTQQGTRQQAPTPARQSMPPGEEREIALKNKPNPHPPPKN